MGFSELEDAAGQDGLPDAVRRTLFQYSELPWEGGGAGERLGEIHQRLAEWFAFPEGGKYLNTVLQAIRRKENEPIDLCWTKWLKELSAANAIKIYPHIFDYSPFRIQWTAETPFGENFSWKYDAGVPVGDFVGDHVRFSVDPAQCEGTFSPRSRI